MRFSSLGFRFSYGMTVAWLVGAGAARFAAGDILDLGGQTIPGTAGITPGPGVDLSGWNSAGHRLQNANLANFNLAGALFTNSDMSGASFYKSTLTNADFTGATVSGASFFSAGDFTYAQLVSTQSYQQKALAGVSLASQNMSGWDLSGQNLTRMGATFANFAGANLGAANLTSANLFSSNLQNASFTDAIVQSANLGGTSITYAQLASTATFQQNKLAGIALGQDNLAGWDLSEKNLSGAHLGSATLTNASLLNANLTSADLDRAFVGGANFTGVTLQNVTLAFAKNFTFSQLATTKSYQQLNLSGVNFNSLDMTGWNLSSQNLSNANLPQTKLAGANLNGANLTNASLVFANLTNASMIGVNFQGSVLDATNLTGADLRSVTNWIPVPSTNLHNTIQSDGSIYALDLRAGETLIVRNYFLPITLATSAAIHPAGRIQVLLAPSWQSVIHLDPIVVPALDGTLDLSFAEGVDPSTLVGQTFQLFEWYGPLADGNDFSNITTLPGVTWDVSNLYTAGTVTLTAVPEPTSLGLLGCGGAMLLLWRRGVIARVSAG